MSEFGNRCGRGKIRSEATFSNLTRDVSDTMDGALAMAMGAQTMAERTMARTSDGERYRIMQLERRTKENTPAERERGTGRGCFTSTQTR